MTDSKLAQVEEQYGFTFGDPDHEHKRLHSVADGTGARHIGTAVCNNPGCESRDHVAYYEDTPLPLHCGQCSFILVANPDSQDASLHVTGLDLSDTDQFLDEIADRVTARLRADAHPAAED